MRVKYLTTAPWQTKKLGEILAKEVLKSKSRNKGALPGGKPKKGASKEHFQHPPGRALIIGLEGDLGGGKTTFLQGFAKGLGVKEKILSPTFVIIKKFKIQKTNSRFQNLYHIDCYRIERPKEILDLGFKRIISDLKNIVTIEWVGRIRKMLPAGAIILKFEFIDQKTRKITVVFKNDS
jgi:tRNA threonylcarbamoyladenosine biosynthesis protein TsaE